MRDGEDWKLHVKLYQASVEVSACVCQALKIVRIAFGAMELALSFPHLRANLSGRRTDAEASVLGPHSDSAAKQSRQATCDVKGEDGQAD